MPKKDSPEHVLNDWMERDLTAAAAAGELLPAFEIDDQLRRVTDLLGSGRHPVVVGEPGVGKTSLIYELVRRAAAGEGPDPLRGKRVVQLSFKARAAAFERPHMEMRPATQKLVTALRALAPGVVPFLRDLDVAESYNLEPQLMQIAACCPIVLSEANAARYDTMLEMTPELDTVFLGLPMAEPDGPAVLRMLRRWAEHESAAGRAFDDEALEMAVELTNRFVPRLRFPRKVIDLLNQVSRLTEGTATADDVITRFTESFRVPRLLADPSINLDTAELDALFRSRVLEQPEAVATVVRMVSLIKAGLSDMRRPFGSFLFVGPTGVGKTHIAQLLAEYLFGSRDRMVRLNMADYAEDKDAFTLFGHPDHNEIRLRRGVLTSRLMGHPMAVLLLDEFEKAHAKTHDRFLQLIDEGAFINGAGETLSCRSLIVIATSNAGAEVYRGQSLGFSSPLGIEAMDRELDRRLHQHFRFEFLNRFDQIVHFHPLSRQGIRTIALREIAQLGERAGLKSRDIRLEVDDTVLDWLTAHGYDPNFGARFLRRTIERNLTTAVAEALVQDPPPKGGIIELSARGGRIVARVKAEARDEKPKRLAVSLPEGPGTRIRSLDRDALIREGDALLDRTSALRADLEQRRGLAGDLLERMNAEAFWERSGEVATTIEEYRVLDLSIQAESRISQPLTLLAEVAALGYVPQGTALARIVEEAAQAVHDWEDRQAEEGPSHIWLVIRNVDPSHNADAAIEQLAQMELRWAERLHLAAEVVAFGMIEGVLARAVLSVEGPGASACLAMEVGIHRIRHGERNDLRLRVDVVPGGAPDGAAGGLASGELSPRPFAIQKRFTELGLEASSAVRIARSEAGEVVELLGAHPPTLATMAASLILANVFDETGRDVARTYGHGGVAARDPRTGAALARQRDVTAGKLDPLLDAWRARPHAID